MRINNPYIISFSGLPVGEHTFEIVPDKDFLTRNNIEDIYDLQASVTVILEKLNNLYKLNICIEGSYHVECDRCNEMFSFPLQVQEQLFLKLGQSTGQESESIIVLHENAHDINLEPYIYEFITLSIPKRKVHPEGLCNPEVIKKLEQLSVTEESVKDPRWEILKNVKL